MNNTKMRGRNLLVNRNTVYSEIVKTNNRQKAYLEVCENIIRMRFTKDSWYRRARYARLLKHKSHLESLGCK